MKEQDTRIGINIGKAGREDRGISVYTQEILNEFSTIDPEANFLLLHYPGKTPENKLGLENGELVPLAYKDSGQPLVTILNEQLINPIQQKQLELDVVWHPHNRGQFLTPTGYVTTMHDVLPIAAPELADKYLNTRQKKALYNSRTYSARYADHVITVSDFSRSEIVTHLGIPESKISVVYSGVDKEVYKPDKSEERRREVKDNYSLPDRYILTTGSYAPHKNQKTIVDAYNMSLLSENGVGLVMAGPNDATGYRVGYEEVREHVERLGLEDKVRLLPSVSQQDKITLYSNAEAFITASLYEGFGLTLLEAMACEVPVVASLSTAIPEVCGNAALYSEPMDSAGYANHLDSLFGDSELRECLVGEGKAQVAKYNWDITAKKTYEILNSVAKNRS